MTLLAIHIANHDTSSPLLSPRRFTPCTCLRSAKTPVHDEPHVHVDPTSPLFMWYIAIVIGLVLLGGLFSGLTLGLMGLDSVSRLIPGDKTTSSSRFPRSHALTRLNRSTCRCFRSLELRTSRGRRPRYSSC